MGSDTNPVPAPTPADLSRDLAADLRAIGSFGLCHWSPQTLADVASAAIRRSLAAEAECERLRAALGEIVKAIRGRDKDIPEACMAECVLLAREALEATANG